MPAATRCAATWDAFATIQTGLRRQRRVKSREGLQGGACFLDGPVRVAGVAGMVLQLATNPVALCLAGGAY